MAITTMAGLVAALGYPQPYIKPFQSCGASGNLHSGFFGVNGIPAAAAAPSPGMAGEALTSYAGQINYRSPSSGNTYLGRIVGNNPILSTYTLCDRLWHNSGIVVTTTTSQTVTSVAWPARDRNASTNGDGVLVALEVSTATTNGAVITNSTISYTNSAGTAGRTGTLADLPGHRIIASAVKGSFAIFLLDGGDIGVRSVESITLNTSLVSGAVHLVAFRPIASFVHQATADRSDFDALSLGFPRIYDNAVPFMTHIPNSSGITVGLDLTFCRG